MKVKICSEAGCNNLIDSNSVYCKKHIKEKIKPFENAIRANELLYNTSKWRQLRKEILKENNWCIKCGIDINLEVHHIIPPRGNEELFFDKGNLTVYCKQCHRIETNREIRERK